MGTIHYKGHTVAIYVDIPFSVLVEKRKLAPVASRLREHSMKYCWGLEVSLFVESGRETITLTSAEDPEPHLQALGLSINPRGASPEAKNKDWDHEIRNNNATTQPQQTIPKKVHPQARSRDAGLSASGTLTSPYHIRSLT
ncbi:Hypothetical predicted protein [Pelobates cultripes]|uniref:Uncharacterized protein n=1 Tax=Pelobates cultripes TaxID=61616 RepID=A0AAD1WXU1_PELCU|nr:Hypothetical predicted protein [Pelobates cultripes]